MPPGSQTPPLAPPPGRNATLPAGLVAALLLTVIVLAVIFAVAATVVHTP